MTPQITTTMPAAPARMPLAMRICHNQRVRTPFLPGCGQVPLEHLQEQTRKFPGVAYLQGNEDEKNAALTFDDGPGVYTPALLDVLGRHRVKATFFWVGQWVDKYPSLVQQAFDEGHTLGNHSWNHPYLNKEPADRYWKQQIESTQTAFKRCLGVLPRLFRPPYGFLNDSQIPDFAACDMKVLMWSVAGDDWYHTDNLPEADAVKAIAGQVLDYVHPGAIVLLHDGGGNTRVPTVHATDIIITKLKALGYRFVTVDNLIGTAPYF